MKLELFETPGEQRDRVLLMYEPRSGEVEAVRAAVLALAAGAPGMRASLDALPGLEAVGGCSLLAELGETDLGVEPLSDEESALRCVLSSEGWRRVADLLEPFLVPAQGEHFQYLTEAGEIEWIVSTHRGW